MSVNLRDLARDVASTADSLEYADLASEVLSRLTPKEYRAALAQALPVFVRATVVAQRQAGAAHPPASATSPELPAMPGSWKVHAIRDGWQRRLSEIYATESGNKRLGDFTIADLTYQADLLRVQAKRKFAKAAGWQSLADAVGDARVERVRDLPAETLMVALGAVA